MDRINEDLIDNNVPFLLKYGLLGSVNVKVSVSKSSSLTTSRSSRIRLMWMWVILFLCFVLIITLFILSKRWAIFESGTSSWNEEENGSWKSKESIAHSSFEIRTLCVCTFQWEWFFRRLWVTERNGQRRIKERRQEKGKEENELLHQEVHSHQYSQSYLLSLENTYQNWREPYFLTALLTRLYNRCKHDHNLENIHEWLQRGLAIQKPKFYEFQTS